MSDLFLKVFGGPPVACLPTGPALPSGGEVMRMFYYYTGQKIKTYDQCAQLIAHALRKKWLADVNRETIGVRHIVKPIMRFHQEYLQLRKAGAKGTGGAAYEKRRQSLKSKLDELFDIGSKVQSAPSNASRKEAARADVTTASSGLDSYHRKPRSRPSSATGSASVKAEDEEIETRDVLSTETSETSDTDFELDTDSDTSVKEEPSELSSVGDSPELLGYLDKGATSSRNAFRTVASTLSITKQPLKKMKCSLSTLWRRRMEERARRARQIRENFQKNKGKCLVVHWDGIKVDPLAQGSRRKLVERLPVVVTGHEVDQLLGARVISSSSGEHTAAEVVRCTHEWDCADDIVAECSDTPTGNTGYNIGAACRIEKALNKYLIYFACRHHILELIPSGLFDKLVEKSSSPDIGALWKSLQERWENMNHDSFTPATNDPACRDFLQERRDTILSFALEYLEKPHTRADYRHLLQLVVIFMGENPFKPKEIRFRPPIAISSARFMARIIYCLMIHTFYICLL